MRKRLTKSVIDALPAKDRQYKVWDESMPCFGVKVNPGSKSYILQTTVHGKDYFKTIGRFGITSLDDARRKARSILAKLEEGEPLEPRPQTTVTTFGDLADEYLKYVSEEIDGRARKKTWKKDEERLKAYGQPLWNMPLSEITSKTILDLHRELSTKRVSQRWKSKDDKKKKVGVPGGANRFLACVRAMFNFALVQEYHPGPNPVNRLVKFNPEKTRADAFIRPEQFPAFWEALNEEPNIYVQNLFKVILFSGSRPEEVKQARWADVDMENRIWTKTDTKNGQKQLVPLTDMLHNLFDSTPKVLNNPYVFVSLRNKGGHVANVQKNWNRIATQAKLEGIVARDLRRTFTVYARECGFSREDVKSILNHTSRHADVTERYSPMRLVRVKEAMEATATYIGSLCGQKNGQPTSQQNPPTAFPLGRPQNTASTLGH